MQVFIQSNNSTDYKLQKQHIFHVHVYVNLLCIFFIFVFNIYGTVGPSLQILFALLAWLLRKREIK